MVICNILNTIKLAIILMVSITITGCGDSISQNIVVVNKSIKLTQNYHNTQFRISGNSTLLDLNGYTISSSADDKLVILESGFKSHGVINGNIVGSPFGIGVYIASCISENDVPMLLSQGSNYESTIYSRCSSSPIVKNINLEGFNDGIYVAPYIEGAIISENKFSKVDQVALYLDTGSKKANVSNNLFINNGWRFADSKYMRKRGHISIDASYSNIIINNTFDDTGNKWAKNGGVYPAPQIELYRNCGEKISSWKIHPILPRLHGADNNTIKLNTFKKSLLSVWFAYRRHDNICQSVIYPDKSDNNKLINNKFESVETIYIDDGFNNTFLQ